MFDPDTLRKLCVICADLGTALTLPTFTSVRSRAHQVLCREMVARLRDSMRDYEIDGADGLGGHQAFLDYAIVDSLKGGIKPALFYFYHSDGVSGGSVAREPDRGYAALFPSLATEAASVISDAQDLESVDWLESQRFRLSGNVAPGASYSLLELFSYTVAPTANVWTSATINSLVRATSLSLSAGNKTIEATVDVSAADDTVGLDVGYTIKINGTPQTSQTISRAHPADGDDRDVVTRIDGSNDCVLVGTNTVTVVNACAVTQRLSGILRYFVTPS